jgi:hypothetical protein
MPATDHTVTPARAVPKEVINSGPSKRRKGCARKTLLTNAYQARKSRKGLQVGERPQVRDFRIVPILTNRSRKDGQIWLNFACGRSFVSGVIHVVESQPESTCVTINLAGNPPVLDCQANQVLSARPSQIREIVHPMVTSDIRIPIWT